MLVYLPLFAIPVTYDSPLMAMCHNGGLLPMMCFLLLCCSLETDLLASCLGSSVAKVLGRISYCQYIIQGTVRQLMLQQLFDHFSLVFPIFLVVLVTTAYLMEWLVSGVVDCLLSETSVQHAPLEPVLASDSETSEESSSEDRRETDLWACGL